MFMDGGLESTREEVVMAYSR